MVYIAYIIYNVNNNQNSYRLRPIFGHKMIMFVDCTCDREENLSGPNHHRAVNIVLWFLPLANDLISIAINIY